MTAANPLESLLIPRCPAREASEVARKLKLAATKRAWRKANPDKQRLYWRTYVESLKMKPAIPAAVVTLSDLVQQVADLKTLVLQLVIDKQQTIAITGKSLVITKPPAAPQRVSSR